MALTATKGGRPVTVPVIRPRIGDVDAMVAERIRARRLMLGISQNQLAAAIGVTYQQAHKYECGINRISAGRLYQIAEVLGVNVGYFFEPAAGGDALSVERQRMCLDLARNFAGITNEGYREALCLLARALASGGEFDGH
jgi:transcriptional regulator with XRE-family HTH domain